MVFIEIKYAIYFYHRRCKMDIVVAVSVIFVVLILVVGVLALTSRSAEKKAEEYFKENVFIAPLKEESVVVSEDAVVPAKKERKPRTTKATVKPAVKKTKTTSKKRSTLKKI